LKYILGADPSFVESGVAVLSTEGVVMAYCTIKTSSKQPESVRLKKIYDALFAIAGDYSISEMAIETPFVSISSVSIRLDTSIKLGMVRGIFALFAGQNQIEMFSYAPATVKASMAKGNSSKEAVAFSVKMLTGIDTKNNNISDAIAVGLCHLLHRKWVEIGNKKM